MKIYLVGSLGFGLLLVWFMVSVLNNAENTINKVNSKHDRILKQLKDRR